jgi:amidase
LTQTSRALDAFFETYDLLLSPVARHSPKLLGEYATDLPFDVLFERAVGNSDFTPVFNAAGTPAMSIPLNLSANDLPVGSHFVARVGAEATLFGLAFQQGPERCRSLAIQSHASCQMKATSARQRRDS